MKNYEYCLPYEELGIYLRVADDQESWFTTQESYDRAVEKHGEESDEPSYEAFCNEMDEVDINSKEFQKALKSYLVLFAEEDWDAVREDFGL